MRFNEILYTPEFQRDIKKLRKRFRTLDDDLDNFINAALVPFHKLDVDIRGVVRVSGIGIEQPGIYKARRFACRSLKGTGSNSGIRIIYAYFDEKDKVVFIEIYFKGDKENEDRERILRFIRSLEGKE
jgi:mRNA-degrading endonuclease RelE of RelBE toxin-antitoxin system